MAYDYIGLVNEVNRRLNEVELTSTTFNTATGFYAHIKDAVNASIRDINQTHYEWPFNHVLKEETLTAGVTRYAFPNDAGSIDFDSFRIKRSSTFNNNTIKLSVVAYEDYLENAVDQEYDTSTAQRTIPSSVFHAPSLQWGVTPAPNQAYEIVYEYYSIPSELSTQTAVPNIPERFRHIIIDGAMYHAYLFRSNEQAASLAKAKFEEGMKRMRIILVNRYSYVRSTVISGGQINNNRFGPRIG
jgi:hypothetical protein